MKKFINKSLIAIIAIVAFAPFFDAQAGDGSFIYRSTQMGSGTRQTGQWEYEITNEKYDFSASESVFALTRIFNITKVDTFQFKYEIQGDINRDMLSPVYRPNRNWWAEIWYWDEFGKLPAGQYSLNTMISIDGGGFRHFNSKQFRVNGLNYYKPVNNYVRQSEQVRNYDYDYAWTKTDNKINFYGNYKYGANNPKDVFDTNEDIKVLTRLSDIHNIDTFKIRHELHRNGHFVKRIESNDRKPNRRDWEYNYTESNFGRLSAGSYEIKIYLSIEGKAWRLLDVKEVKVSGNPYLSNNYNYNWTRVGNDFDYPLYYGYDTPNYPDYVNYPFSERQL